MQLQDYIKQKKQSLVESNKKLSEDKLRVEGAWIVLQEIEEIITAPKSPKGDFEEDKNHPVSEIHCHPSTEGNKPKTKTKQGAK